MELNIQELESNAFCQKIEEEVETGKTYIQSVIDVCEGYGIGPEFGAKFLTKPIIEKIQQEGESINLLPKISKLPI